MSLKSILGKVLNVIVDDLNTPESFKIGEKFEKYVRDSLFIDRYYDLVERTHNYTTNKDYVESSLKPDFKFRDKITKKEFYVEAKFRRHIYNNKVQWCKSEQLKRYLSYNKGCSTFVIIGIGENPSAPEFLSLLPLQYANYTELFVSHLEKFEIKTSKPISSKILWSRIGK